MGAIYKYKCGCGYEEELFLGSGRSYGNAEIAKKMLPEDIFDSFMKEQRDRILKQFSLSNAVIACPDCRELCTVTRFGYKTETGENVLYTSPCPVCGKECLPAEDEERLRCPRCGEEMQRSRTGFWD